MANLPRDSAVILVDGDCALCNGYARFIAATDHGEHFYFETQQSPQGQALLTSHGEPCDLSTIIVVEREGQEEETRCYKRSTAVLRTMRRLNFPWCLLYWLILIPEVIRDFVYNFVARNRYRIFGKTEACELPPAAVRKRLTRVMPGRN